MKALWRATVFFLILFVTEMGVAQPVSASDSIRIFIDRVEINTSSAPIIIDGRSQIPMRSIFEALGAKVDWDNETSKVTATKNDITIELTIGSSVAFKNKQPISLQVPAQIIDSSTFVPLRFVSEALGYNVYWNGKANAVFISTKGEDSELARQEEFSKVETWIQTYGGVKGDHGWAIKQTKDGGYILVGDTKSYNDQDQSDVYLIKLDNLGNTKWEKTYGGPDNDRGISIEQTNDNGYIFAVNTSPIGNNLASSVSIIKTDETGVVQWERLLSNYNDYAHFYGAIQTKDGGYAGIGKKPNKDWISGAWLIKLDEKGAVQWENIYVSGIYDPTARTVAQDEKGNFIIAGSIIRTSSAGRLNGDLYITKTDEQGNVLWEQIFGEDAWEDINSVKPTSDGGYIMAGTSWLIGSSWHNAIIIKVDGNGKIDWQKIYGGPGDDYAESILESSDGNFVFAGNTEPNGIGTTSRNYYLVKINPQGEIVFEKSFGDGRYDRCRSIDLCFDGGYILGGTSYDSNDYTNTGDIYIIKTDANGNL